MAHMARPPQRPRRLQGLTFYSTAFVISLFAAYSIIRSFAHDHGYTPSLHARSLRRRDEECRLVHNSHNQCAFVRANCPDEEAGLISYLQLYYCSLQHAKPVAFVILVVWISLLFSTIGIAASDFLCINLSTIATILGMSESLTGVTFLAFGNGSPDVFSTFAAMSTNSGSLAVGELMGAAGFITAVVAGSMAMVKPFQVAKRSFVRDVGFFAVAASFSLVFLADGRLRLWECVTMVGFYVFYVIFVVAWHWWQQRSRRIRLSETAARLQHHIPDQQELEVPEFEDDEESRPAGERSDLLRAYSGDSIPTLLTPNTPAWMMDDADDDDETRDRHLAELQSNMRVSRPGRGERRNTMTPIRPSLIGALEFRSVLSSLEKKSTNSQPIGLRRYSDEASYVLGQAGSSQFAISQPELVTGNVEQRNTDLQEHGLNGRNRAVSANDAAGLKLDRDLLGVSNSTPQTAIFSPNEHSSGHRRKHSETHLSPRPQSPNLLRSPSASSQGSSPSSSHARRNGFLAPPRAEFRRPDYQDDDQSRDISPATSPNMDVPILQIPDPGNKKYPRYTDSPQSTPLHSRAPSMHLPPPSMSPESAHELPLLPHEDDENELRTYKWWPYEYMPSPQVILSTLFPTLYGWREKGLVDKLLGLVTAPSVFLLTITLPVVEAKNNDDLPNPDPALLSPEQGRRSRSQTLSLLVTDTPAMAPKPAEGESTPHPHHGGLGRQASDYFKGSQRDPVSSAKDWNRWLVILQIFTAPLFVVFIVWANLEECGMKELTLFVLCSLVFSLVCLLVLLATTASDREPQFRPLFCFLGFAVAIAWISTIANEVVGVLKAFGVILGISDAILGLTIFAVGNSLGDLVADITVAKLGYPVMALSACFGGPMLNILLGIGIGGMYMTIHNSNHKHHKHPDRPIKYKPYELEVSTTLMVSGITLLVTLLGLLIVVPMNGWKLDRKIGIGLITLWSLSTIANVVCEVLGVGGEWESRLLPNT